MHRYTDDGVEMGGLPVCRQHLGVLMYLCLGLCRRELGLAGTYRCDDLLLVVLLLVHLGREGPVLRVELVQQL